jgi:hypothetical protein
VKPRKFISRFSDSSGSSLTPGDGWWAAIEGISDSQDGQRKGAPIEDQGQLLYSPVIAWERYTDSAGEPAMRAWLSGVYPIASDRLHNSCTSYFINHFVPERPPRGRIWIWA